MLACENDDNEATRYGSKKLDEKSIHIITQCYINEAHSVTDGQTDRATTHVDNDKGDMLQTLITGTVGPVPIYKNRLVPIQSTVDQIQFRISTKNRSNCGTITLAMDAALSSVRKQCMRHAPIPHGQTTNDQSHKCNTYHFVQQLNLHHKPNNQSKNTMAQKISTQ